jgi:RED-like protein N-terminal region
MLPPSQTRKFRSSAAPKGAKLASGYHDRTQDRIDPEADDKAMRVKAIEEQFKLGQIERDVYETLISQLIGGDLDSTHLVKGLDFRLLERVRRGEDVLAEGLKGKAEGTPEGPSEAEKVGNFDEELEKLEDREIVPIQQEKKEKKGSLAIAGKKRTRDEILAELRESRLSAAAAKKALEQPALGSKFKRLGESREERRIERDEKGREVLITVDEDGHVKRKVKKTKVDQDAVRGEGLLMPDKDIAPLGMVVPEAPPILEEEDEIDIFEGVGIDYDPLAGMDDSASDSEDFEDERPAKRKEAAATKAPEASSRSVSPSLAQQPVLPPKKAADTASMPAPPLKSRNYFNTPSTEEDKIAPVDPTKNPTILAALQKAASLHATNESNKTPTSTADEARRKRLLDNRDRDDQDLDMGFGSSRFEDEADGADDGGKVKLSNWRGKRDGWDDEGDEDEKGEKKEKRKRGGKKRKGDKNNADDVLGVLERRKAAEGQ